MVIVDTSIWITHLRDGSPRLEKLLMDAEVVCHPFIIGELACGNLKSRTQILSLLQSLPVAPIIENEEVLYFIEQKRLMGKGVGLVDVHLLASACLVQIPLWTSDRKLRSVATALDIAYR
jgi:predicted nucleic acid-binding protein